jgi:hypothetical protein
VGKGTTEYNISEKYKFIWLAPERTGSRKVAEILSYYGFTNGGSTLFRVGEYNFSHYSKELDKYEGYKLICNTRNPYSRVYSLFKNFHSLSPDKSKESFKKYLINDLSRGQTNRMLNNPPHDIKPDYLVRVEYMTEDLLKLPFIFDVLTEKQVRLFSYHEKPIEDWEVFYDDESKNIVYNLLKYQFDLFGYEK